MLGCCFHVANLLPVDFNFTSATLLRVEPGSADPSKGSTADLRRLDGAENQLHRLQLSAESKQCKSATSRSAIQTEDADAMASVTILW